MLTVDDALTICRALASLAGEPDVEEDTVTVGFVAPAIERLLFDLQIARDESAHYRELLVQWGIPAKRRTVRRLENGGFEAGWDD